MFLINVDLSKPSERFLVGFEPGAGRVDRLCGQGKCGQSAGRALVWCMVRSWRLGCYLARRAD
jgi:hypothetical protein